VREFVCVRVRVRAGGVAQFPVIYVSNALFRRQRVITKVIKSIELLSAVTI
jgi:hypothetical protein